MPLDFRYRYSVLAFVCSVSGLPLAAGAAPMQLVPADSFIAQHVGTVSELHQQITLDPVVRRRLARHFHTSAPAVTRYIQDNLVLTKLKKAGRYQVYCVGRNGQEYTINSRLAAGTPVFVMRSTGQPVLKLACGNPMVAALPPVSTKVAAYQSPVLAPAPAPVPAAPLPTLSSNGPVVVALADTPGVVVMPTTKVAGFIGQLPVVHGGGFPFGYLAAIPVIAAVTSHGGGNGGPGTTGTTTGTGSTGPGTTGTDTATGTGTTGTGTTGTGSTGTMGTNTSTGTTGTGTTGTGTTGTTSTGTTGTGTMGTSTGNTGVTPVPEPSTPAAFAVGGAALLYLLGSAKKRRSKIG